MLKINHIKRVKLELINQKEGRKPKYKSYLVKKLDGSSY